MNGSNPENIDLGYFIGSSISLHNVIVTTHFWEHAVIMMNERCLLSFFAYAHGWWYCLSSADVIWHDIIDLLILWFVIDYCERLSARRVALEVRTPKIEFKKSPPVIVRLLSIYCTSWTFGVVCSYSTSSLVSVGKSDRLGMLLQPFTSTQPGRPFVWRRSE